MLIQEPFLEQVGKSVRFSSKSSSQKDPAVGGGVHFKQHGPSSVSISIKVLKQIVTNIIRTILTITNIINTVIDCFCLIKLWPTVVLGVFMLIAQQKKVRPLPVVSGVPPV